MTNDIILDAKKKFKEDDSSWFDSWFGPSKATDKIGEPATQKVPQGFSTLSESQMSNVRDNYVKSNPGKTPTFTDLQNFYEENNNAAK
jgi:hypothetical protein